MRELFVYYRVRSGDETGALSVVAAFQNRLRQRHKQLEARLLRRSGLGGGEQTWMETYAMNPQPGEQPPWQPSQRQDVAGISEQLQQEIESMAAELAPYLDGPRHLEIFIASL